MLKTVFTFVVASFFCCAYAAQNCPVDVCYMIADLKYNDKQGVKICEIQQSSLSAFNGDIYRNVEEEKSIHKELLSALSHYNQKGWVVSNRITDKKLVLTLANAPFWKSPKDLISLFFDPNFKQEAKKPPEDIYDLSSYQGFLYINWSELSIISDFEKRFPGLIVIDKSSFPLWIDKYRMTQLFAEDELLANFKPKWGHYKKIYTKELASQIAEDLKCETFVIKPRGEFLGKGVIIIEREHLDEVLSYIITKKGKLAKSKDPSYTAWKKDLFDTFIVEEFIVSDLIKIPHLENKTYQPTMRVAFLLVYNQHSHHVHFLGEYWKTPPLSIEEEGDFMQKNKDICKPPYYAAVDEKTKQAVQNELSIALPLLHSKMLDFYSSSEGQTGIKTTKQNVQLLLIEQPKLITQEVY